MSHSIATRFPGRKKSITAALTFLVLAIIVAGVMAKNGWLPSTDPLSGKKTGWFGRELPRNASSSWNPLAAPSPTPTPQLSKEYIYAGSRLLAVEDANANAAPPADLAVWRPSTGVWYVVGGAGSQATQFAWGDPTDFPVPGDYDGDGKTDFSVYRKDANAPFYWTWYIVNSSDSSTSTVTWGEAKDKPAPADYDGDGKTDQAVFRPGTATWYIKLSSAGNMLTQQFGLSTDVPAPADYDGDGAAEMAVWADGIKKFSSKNIVTGVETELVLDQPADTPVSADYDGDGKADHAIYNKMTGYWYVRRSSDAAVATHIFGNSADDLSVQNDYDGDGKVDVAVWRPSTGYWYIKQTSRSGHQDEIRSVHWGQTGDIPVPAFYRR